MSRRKEVVSWLFVALTLILVGFSAAYVLLPQLQPKTTVHLGDGVFTARIASKQEDRIKGLSDTDSLPVDEGLLMVYDDEGRWGIWMKDMHYPIDIVWLDVNKKVVHIVKNAPPDSYPQTYVPKENAKYILELNAGTVDNKAIQVGDAADFDETKREGWL